MSYEPDNLLFNDDGEPIGYLDQAEDGNFVLHDGAGTVLDAATPDGQPLDPNAYEMDAGQEQPYEPAPAQQYAPEQMHAPLEPDWSELGAQLDEAQRMLGRRMTRAEQEAAGAIITRQFNAGQQISLPAALEQAYVTGAAEPIDLGTRQGKTSYIVDQLDQQNPEPPAPAEQEFDLGEREGKVGYVMARLNGAEASEAPGDSHEAT